MKELSVIAIYTPIASGHILLAVRILRFFQKLKRLRHSFLHVQWRCYDSHLVLISSILEQAKVFKTQFFRLWPLKVKGHFKVTSHLWLICQWLNNSEHFGACCNLLSASEQKIWPFNWRKVRKKSWPMMTSKSDPRGHPGLKLCVRVSVMGYYRVINFHQNRRGRGFSWATSRGMTHMQSCICDHQQ